MMPVPFRSYRELFAPECWLALDLTHLQHCYIVVAMIKLLYILAKGCM